VVRHHRLLYLDTVHSGDRLFSGRGFVPAAPLLAVVLWSRRPGKGKLAKILEESSVGGSVNRAQTLVDEIAQFERE
jgi:hypothetical protein